MTTPRVVAIRKENKNQWERRAPLSPAHVRELREKYGVRVLVQRSGKRCFPENEYAKAGAEIVEDIHAADIVLGVKEVNIDELIAGKTYVFFSHTIKAQSYNMPLLDALLEKRIRLFDYERIQDAAGKRTVAFGEFAGCAGLINMIRCMGEFLLARGQSTPLLDCPYSNMHPSLEVALENVRRVGQAIAEQGVPEGLHPLTFVLTGRGNAYRGVKRVMEELPVKWITVDELQKLDTSADRHKLYAVSTTTGDLVQPKAGSTSPASFDKKDYYAHPENYESVFASHIAPYASVIVNCMYWDRRFPKLLTQQEMRVLKEEGRLRTWGVCDITCDPMGSLECTLYGRELAFNTGPAYTYSVDDCIPSDDLEVGDIVVMAIDHLPCEFPREATSHFGNALVRLLPSLCLQGFDNDDELHPELRRANVCRNGELTPNFAYIAELRKKHEDQLLNRGGAADIETALQRRADERTESHLISDRASDRASSINASRRGSDGDYRSVLMLGAGFCAPPLLDTLLEDSSISVTIGTLYLSDAEKLIADRDRDRVSCVEVDVSRAEDLALTVGEHDLVVSFVPYDWHPIVARACIRMNVPMVTASYVSDGLRALDEEARNAGVLILNEVGADPGIDHLIALQMFQQVRAAGGLVRSFTSWCGGLPTAAAAQNALRYRFNWSPMAVTAPASGIHKYLEKGSEIVVEGKDIFKAARSVDIVPTMSFEGVPNRDSVTYKAKYGLADATSVFRGTLRFPGFFTNMQTLLEVGLLDRSPVPMLAKGKPAPLWLDVLRDTLGLAEQASLEDVKEAVRSRCSDNEGAVQFLDVLGLFEEGAHVVPDADSRCGALTAVLAEQFAYQPGQLDQLVLHTEVGAEMPDGSERTLRSTMIVEGETDGPSAMAKCVGVTAGLTCRMVISGDIDGAGVHAPWSLPQMVSPLVERLGEHGITLDVEGDLS